MNLFSAIIISSIALSCSSEILQQQQDEQDINSKSGSSGENDPIEEGQHSEKLNELGTNKEDEELVSTRLKAGIILDHPHSSVTLPDDNRRIPFRLGDSWGYLNEAGEVVVAATYSKVNFCNEGYCLVTSTAGGTDSFSLLSLSGEMVLQIPNEYKWTNDQVNGGLLGVCTSNSKPRNCGYIDIEGNVAISMNFDSVKPFLGDYGVITIDTGTDLCAPAAMVIDKTGLEITGRYRSVRPLWQGHFMFLTGTGCLNAKSWVGTADGSRLATSIVGATGYPEVPNKGIPSHGLLLDRKSDMRYQYIDSSSYMTAFDHSFSSANEFSEGLAAVCNERDDCGYINTKGSWVLDGFEVVSSFRYGFAKVERRKIGSSPKIWIDRTGKQVEFPNFIGEPEIISPKLLFWKSPEKDIQSAITDWSGELIRYIDEVRLQSR